MKTFWEDLGKKLGETAETVTSKAGEAMEIQKIKNQIRILENSNESDLAELGRMVYKRFKEGGIMSEEAAARCEAIQSREETIEDYLKKIIEVKGEYACACCGKTITKGMVYCPYCGERAPENPKSEPAADMDKMFNDMKEKAADVAGKAKSVVGEMAEKAAGMAEKAAGKAGEMADKAAAKATEMAEKVAEKMEDAAENVVDVVDDVAEEVTETVQEKAEKVKDAVEPAEEGSVTPEEEEK